jgi:hypothetical protein
METLLALVSLTKILALPWYVGITGLALIALFLLSAIRSVLRLRVFAALTNIIAAFVIAVILTQGGEAIVQLIGVPPQS